MAGSHATKTFDRAITSRDIIGQAEGIIMERFDADDVHAFAMLTRHSLSTNTKLVDVARHLVRTCGTQLFKVCPPA